MTKALSGRSAPVLLGILTSVLFAWTWGSLDAVPTVHDEAAYVLQAEIFAGGHWTAPAPPIPEFFEQFHVFVQPRLASKYPPGHSILLVPGIWLGLPGLVPIALGGLTGALAFVLARRVANPWVALLAWFLWTTAPGELLFHPTYMSEVSTTALLLVAWWALLAWRQTERSGYLVLVAVCMAWSALARPFSTVALLVPIAVVVLATVSRRRLWRGLWLAAAAGAFVLLLVPAWSRATTGDARLTPYALYSKIYFPYQRPGFGAPVTESLRPLPADFEAYSAEFEKLHRGHTVANLPRIAASRAGALVRHMWGGWRLPLLLFFFVGLFGLPAAGVFAMVSAVALVAQYLFLAHSRDWTVYYLEIQPALAFVTALGVWRAAAAAGARFRRTREAAEPSGRFAPACVALLVAAAIAPAARTASDVRRMRALDAAPQERFRALVRGLPPPAIVFVRYGPDHQPHRSLVVNDPDLARSRAWVVYDRGEDDVRLLRAAPERAPFLYDEALGKIVALPQAAPADRYNPRS